MCGNCLGQMSKCELRLQIIAKRYHGILGSIASSGKRLVFILTEVRLSLAVVSVLGALPQELEGDWLHFASSASHMKPVHHI